MSDWDFADDSAEEVFDWSRNRKLRPRIRPKALPRGRWRWTTWDFL